MSDRHRSLNIRVYGPVKVTQHLPRRYTVSSSARWYEVVQVPSRTRCFSDPSPNISGPERLLNGWRKDAAKKADSAFYGDFLDNQKHYEKMMEIRKRILQSRMNKCRPKKTFTEKFDAKFSCGNSVSTNEPIVNAPRNIPKSTIDQEQRMVSDMNKNCGQWKIVRDNQQTYSSYKSLVDDHTERSFRVTELQNQQLQQRNLSQWAPAWSPTDYLSGQQSDVACSTFQNRHASSASLNMTNSEHATSGEMDFFGEPSNITMALNNVALPKHIEEEWLWSMPKTLDAALTPGFLKAVDELYAQTVCSDGRRLVEN